MVKYVDEDSIIKLDVKAFAITTALIWGLSVFIATWWIILFDGASNEATFLGQFYRGYSVSPAGSIIGLIWALVDGLIGGALFAWLYNFFVNRNTK